MSCISPAAFGCNDEWHLGMQGASDDNRTPPIKDRILYWPTILAAFWWWVFVSPLDPGPKEGDLVAGPALTLLGPLLSVAVAVTLCIVWTTQRAWRRVLSAMILPLSVILMIYFVGI
jgi:hypothetical protein